jgi:hypothetical protein
MKKDTIAIVAPVHIQPSQNWIQSLDAVSRGKDNVKVIIVDDSDGKVKLPPNWEVYDYAKQKEVLGEEMYKEFEQFHKSSACKNFGTFLAYAQEFDYVIILDSDCVVPPNLISQHLEAVSRKTTLWQNPINGTDWFPRGFPNSGRALPVAANVGLWINELDINGKDRVDRGQPPRDHLNYGINRAYGIIPFSGMNVCVRGEDIPALLFLPNGEFGEHKFRRHDDIWGGYIFQRIMRDILSKGITYGDPTVFHETEVNAAEDAAAELGMGAMEDEFYLFVEDCFKSMPVVGLEDAPTAMEFFARAFEKKCDKWDGFACFIPAFKFWTKLFTPVKEETK